MKIRESVAIIGASIFLTFIVYAGCKKDNDPDLTPDAFVLSSPEIGSDSLLPVDYTCDGSSATLPVEWRGSPDNTVSYALVMHHEASPTDIHWYWVLYNIPAEITALPKNVTGIGTLGTNSVNDRNSYSPPCSQGPGLKAYIYTVYALSAKPALSVPATQVDRAALLSAIKDITIVSARMEVYYARKTK